MSRSLKREGRTAVLGLSLVVVVFTTPVLAQPGSVVVTVEQCLPPLTGDLTATASGPRDVCTYFWTLAGGVITGGQNSNTLTFQSGPPGTEVTIGAEAHGPSGCTGWGLATSQTQPQAVASGDATICRGYSTPLVGSGGSSCTWFPEEGLDDPRSCTPQATPTHSTMYSVQVADESGCLSTNGASVFISLPFDPPDSVVVDHSLPPETPGITASAGPSFCTFRWTVDGGTITSSPVGRSVTFTSGPPGTRVALMAEAVRSSDCLFSIVRHGRAQVDFVDVPPDDTFHEDVAEIGRRGITAGCGGGRFCPEDPVRRDQTAVLLMKAAHGAACTPPTCVGTFADVHCSSPFASWVEMLASDGITAGCGGGNFCPDRHVTRAQMSVFLLKAKHGAAYVPPPCTRAFADVECPGLFADWIETAHFEGIVTPCQADPPLFCPDSAVTREWMARFLAASFGSPGAP